MIDLGHKPETDSQATEVIRPATVYYPSFYCDGELPLTDKDIGKTIMAMVKLKIKSIEKRANKDGKKESHSFDVLGIEIMPNRKSHYK